MKPTTWGWLSDKSIVRSLPCLVMVTRIYTSVAPWPSSSRIASALVDAVLPAADDRAALPFGAVQHRLDRRMGLWPAEFGGQCLHAAFADMGGADHGGQVARKSRGWRTLVAIMSSRSRAPRPCHTGAAG